MRGFTEILIERIADSPPECQRDVITLSPESDFVRNVIIDSNLTVSESAQLQID
ncbi:MAG: hypothetical protein QOJ51_384 [Acidobacteriaceae bacterium]|jgi:hypothetical protein|nr:hypothetical protein [Acidobacteriaceae bacterium]